MFTFMLLFGNLKRKEEQKIVEVYFWDFLGLTSQGYYCLQVFQFREFLRRIVEISSNGNNFQEVGELCWRYSQDIVKIYNMVVVLWFYWVIFIQDILIWFIWDFKVLI